VLVLYAMIARQPVLDLWLAGVGPGLLMALIFGVYVYLRCLIQPEAGPALPAEERAQITRAEKFALLGEGLLPLAIFAVMMGMFMT
ncbi:MAG: C4-dicarboxylate ABC transporter, partial [Mesorhizobium sp.]